MMSIGATATAHKGQTTGFDYLRLGLSLAVVIYHCLGMSDPFWSQWMANHRPGLALILPAFFALSGFLVTSSFFRNSILEFIVLRVIRLVPALAFEVVLSALLIGSLFTTLTLSGYYRSSGFYAYFLNILGDIHFYLPGVFSGNAINSQLWTIPYEMRCYAILIFVALITLTRFKRFFPAALLIATLMMTGLAVYHNADWSYWHPSGRTLIVSFLWACILYIFRDRVPYHPMLAGAAFVVAETILFAPRYEALAALPIAYLTIYIGLMVLPRIKFGDLSYGIFLFHLPVLQTLRFGLHMSDPWLLLGLTIVLSGLCALVSWRLIEQPVLSRKFAILAWVNRKVCRSLTMSGYRRQVIVPLEI